MRPGPEDPKISAGDQKKHRTGVGMLLYLVKHSRPDLASTVQELSKVLATEAHWKALMRCIKYVLDTKMWIKRCFTWKGFLKVIMPETLKPDLVCTCIVCIFVVRQFHGSLSQVKVSLCHQLKQNILQHQKQPKNLCL
jgi:hypothetical protein